jgi:hypothetical protein
VFSPGTGEPVSSASARWTVIVREPTPVVPFEVDNRFIVGEYVRLPGRRRRCGHDHDLVRRR